MPLRWPATHPRSTLLRTPIGSTRSASRCWPTSSRWSRRRPRWCWSPAEDALIAALAERRSPSGPDAIGLDTPVVSLVDQHIARLAEDGRSVRTLDTYRYDAGKLAK